MELNDSERATLLRSIEFYKNTVKFTLRNRKAKRSNKDVAKFIDIYEQDLLNIDLIESYLK